MRDFLFKKNYDMESNGQRKCEEDFTTDENVKIIHSNSSDGLALYGHENIIQDSELMSTRGNATKDFLQNTMNVEQSIGSVETTNHDIPQFTRSIMEKNSKATSFEGTKKTSKDFCLSTWSVGVIEKNYNPEELSVESTKKKLSKEEALRSGELFLNWLASTRHPEITEVQVMQVQEIINRCKGEYK